MSSLKLYEEEIEAVNESWKRCHQFGLRPTDSIINQTITGKQIHEVIKENEQFIQQATPIFEKLYPFIKQTGHIAVLSDRYGNIIHLAADPEFENQARNIQLQVGANWQEQKKGTNAIGVVLTEEKPVRVHGEQHFYIANHFLTCAASPIYTPTGELVGAINISGRKEQFNPYTLSLACMATDSLQNRLLIEQAKQEYLLTLQELEQTANYHPFPLLSLDREHRIIRANQAAFHILGKDCIGKEFKGKQGFVIKTIADGTQKIWRSTAIYKQDVKQNRLYTFADITGSCPNILHMKEVAQKAAYTDFSVLLFGESGTGKELLAQSIHSAGPRMGHPFIAVNCSAIPESLVESEFFGYVRGAFTGANREGGQGKFEAANHGTIFLDEIGDMSLHAQSTLLRVLQEKTVTPVGGTQSRPINVRIIAATHRNLPEEIRAGRFRADLYYRLKGIQINLPPLRERSDTIEMAQQLLKQVNPLGSLTGEAKNKLLSYFWPGNVRELHSVLIQASFLSEDGIIDAKHLQLENVYTNTPDEKEPTLSLMDAEMSTIKQSLQFTGWNISKAAELLQIGRNTLYRKMKEYNISQL